MKLPCSWIIPAATTAITIFHFVIIFLTNPNPTSAHFFPNITSIPPSLIPNASTWDHAFHPLAGCRKGDNTRGLSSLKKYFQRFGYLDDEYTDFSDDFDGSLESALKNYQRNFNLEATGELDPPTLKRIVLPRCGNPDIVNGTSTMRPGGRTNPNNSVNPTIHTVAHYTFFPGRPRWPRGQTRLSYAFGNDLSENVRGVFARAFARWSEVTPLTFVETASFRSANIRIGFFVGDHGDGEPFDGVLGTLAHAFSPPAGVFHLDGDENWVIDGGFVNAPVSAVDLESVAVHEIGHLLGLGHSSVEEAIMYPTITSGTRKVQLTNDDILGIQELYGSNPNYNGSESGLTPTSSWDTTDTHTGGANRVGGRYLWVVVGSLSLLLLLV